MSFIVTCSSTADMSREYFEERNVRFACFHVIINGKEFNDDYGISMSNKDFYKKITDGAEVSTSQIAPEEYTAFFKPLLEKGNDILHISLSSGISGTWNAAKIAQEELLKSFPERKLIVIDSLGASSGYGMLVDTACDLRDSGVAIEEAEAELERIKLNVNHWFFSTDLTMYLKGGRISKSSAVFGTLLNICPLLNVNDEGKLIPREKCRGKKKVINRIVQMMEENAYNGTDYDGKCFISHSDCIEDAEKVKNLIEDRFPNMKGKIKIYNVGTVIGAHTGVGTVALFFMGITRTR